MTITRWIAWDTETSLIAPGLQAPPLTCVTLCKASVDYGDMHPSTWPAILLGRVDGLATMGALLSDSRVGLVGHNVAFDLLVLLAEDPNLTPIVQAAYEADRITDTMHREQLIDIARGTLRGFFDAEGKFTRLNYTLADLARRRLKWTLEKDEWRLRYAEFRDVPIETWPEGARVYPLHDARATAAVWQAQEVKVFDVNAGLNSRAPAHPFNGLQGYDCLADQFRQARRFFAFRRISAWGLRTDATKVEALAGEVTREIEACETELREAGFVRPNGTRDTKAVARAMVDACADLGMPVPLTDGGQALIASAPEYQREAVRAAMFADGKGISLAEESCSRLTAAPIFATYAEFSALRKVQSNDLRFLARGAVEPIHTRFDIVETGRSSSSGPNVQNIRSLPGIRECFIPRAGYVYMQGDYPGGELKTLAQVCIWLFGFSRLAEIINAGRDPHCEVAARIAHCSYEDALAAYRADKNWRPRKLAKVSNFGLPGGLGAKTFVAYAAQKSYGITLSIDEARDLKKAWIATLPEMRRYFDHIADLCKSTESGQGVAAHPCSLRVRGRSYYTELCNGYFQGLLADASGLALWAIGAEQYADPSSPLFGTRTVNFIHDEFIGEAPAPVAPDDHRASDAVKRMCYLMEREANRMLPDVPFRAGEVEPCLMSHWSKSARTIIDAQGHVQVWTGQG